MCGSLVRVHQAGYTDDLSFWESSTNGNDPVLELGCGHGRITIPLVRAGRKIVGLDLNLACIQYLQSEIEKETQDLQTLWVNNYSLQHIQYFFSGRTTAPVG